MTIPGVDMVVALAIVAAIGDVGRFEQSQKLVSYLGSSTRVCSQSGPGPAYHGRGSDEAGPWACARHARRGGLGGSASAGSVACVLLASLAPAAVKHVAAVATARKLAVLIWHLLSKGESWACGAPASVAREEAARSSGAESGACSSAAARWPKRCGPRVQYQEPSRSERRWVEQAETAYARFVSGWNPRGPKRVCDGRRNRGATMKAARQGLAPRALLFAARSPMRERKIAQIPQENTCRSHQSASAWRRIWPPNRPSAAGLPV